MPVTPTVRDTNALTPVQAAALCNGLTEGEEARIRDVIASVMEKWALWALSELTEHGPLRFVRLQERIEGVSQKSLTATLRRLERDGLITRTVTSQVPIRVDYAATDLGRTMVAQVHPLWLWTAINLQGFAKAQRAFGRRERKTAAAEAGRARAVAAR